MLGWAWSSPGMTWGDAIQLMDTVVAQLGEAAITARFAAVFFRRIRDKELYRVSGWRSWRSFCAFFSPEEPERIDILIRALEVLESRGEKRDFGEAEARQLAGWGGDRRSEQARKDQGGNRHLEPSEKNTATHVERRLRREAARNDDARLARDHQDLATEVEAGRMSLRAAAKEAGIVKARDPLRELKRWWARASDIDRTQLEDFIDAWHREREGAA
jgi:hypothetical protein